MNLLDYICLAFAIIVVVVALCFTLYYRVKTRKTLENASKMIDSAIAGVFSESVFDESLLSSVETKLAQYLSSCSVSSKNLAEEKDRIKELIADISHQTKTPVSNILLYRSPRVGELDGVGIGLYLSREIVSGEGGYIKVVSQQDKGSVFSVYLPREN